MWSTTPKGARRRWSVRGAVVERFIYDTDGQAVFAATRRQRDTAGATPWAAPTAGCSSTRARRPGSSSVTASQNYYITSPGSRAAASASPPTVHGEPLQRPAVDAGPLAGRRGGEPVSPDAGKLSTYDRNVLAALPVLTFAADAACFIPGAQGIAIPTAVALHCASSYADGATCWQVATQVGVEAATIFLGMQLAKALPGILGAAGGRLAGGLSEATGMSQTAACRIVSPLLSGTVNAGLMGGIGAAAGGVQGYVFNGWNGVYAGGVERFQQRCADGREHRLYARARRSVHVLYRGNVCGQGTGTDDDRGYPRWPACMDGKHEGQRRVARRRSDARLIRLDGDWCGCGRRSPQGATTSWTLSCCGRWPGSRRTARSPARRFISSLPNWASPVPPDVLAIEPCPEIEPGRGRVITGTFTTAKCQVMQLAFPAKRSRWNPRHRTASIVWIGAITLQRKNLPVGERLVTRAGKVATVQSIGMKPGLHRVYNLEVEGEHNYYVGETGVLVHNNCARLVNADDGTTTFEIQNKFASGSAESQQLEEFVQAWNEEIEKAGGSMTRRVLSQSDNDLKEAYTARIRAENPEVYPDASVVPGHVPDAAAGGPATGGRIMPLLYDVNSYLAGVINRANMPVGTVYNQVRLVAPL